MIRNVAIIGRGALGIMYAKALMDALGFENDRPETWDFLFHTSDKSNTSLQLYK